MLAYTPPLKDIDFALNNVLDAPSALNALPAIAEVDAGLRDTRAVTESVIA